MPSFKHDYARLTNLARVELPGTTDAGIMQALFEVLHEFFDTTNLWREDITVPIITGTQSYTVTSPSPGEFVRLWQVVDAGGIIQSVVMPDSGVLALRDPPGASATWTATLVKTVGLPITRDAQPEIPDWVLARWAPVILAGVKGHMMATTGKPYSDPAAASYFERKFRQGMIKARTAVTHANTFGVNAWAYPQAFRVRGQRGGFSTRGSGFNSP